MCRPAQPLADAAGLPAAVAGRRGRRDALRGFIRAW